MSTLFQMTRDCNGYNGFGLEFSIENVSTTLAANVAQSTTVPTAYPFYLAVFSFEAGTSVWVSNDGSDAEAPGSSFDTTNSQLNPTARKVAAGSELSFISSDSTAQIGVSYYGLQQ